MNSKCTQKRSRSHEEFYSLVRKQTSSQLVARKLVIFAQNDPMEEMLNTLPQRGKLEWIGLRPKKRAPLQEVGEALLTVEEGLAGDHYAGESGKRQLTLIQAEHLQTVARLLGREEGISPQLTRRNLVVSGINLLAFAERQFQIGEEVILEMTGKCHPCSRMEKNLGAGGYNAMRGHGGITARVIRGGVIRLGDAVSLVL